jgi:hypothetical protein
MRDILDDVGRQYGVTRVYSLGEISLVACVKLILDRVASNGNRPIRVLYLSDFDPAGRSIPVAAARKVEWLIRKHNLDIDLQLVPILLDHDQCVHYQLPRTPLKADAHQFGEGATELDALEALHPGELRSIVTEALDRYYDHDLHDRWVRECADVEAAIFDMTAEVRAEYAEIAFAASDLRNRIELLFAKMAAEITSRAEATETLQPLDEFKSEREIVEHPDPLYDSLRPYEEQIAKYKLFQGRDGAWNDRQRAKRAAHARKKRAEKKASDRDSGMLESRAEEGVAP